MAELHPVLQAWFDARDKALQYAMHLQDRELRQQQLEESKVQHQNQLKMDQARIDQDVALANLRKAGLRLQGAKMITGAEIPGRSNFDTKNYEGTYGINENINRISRGEDPQAETITANIEGLGDITGYNNQGTNYASPFTLIRNIDSRHLSKLISTNDDYKNSGKRDYMTVIPVIESLPTVD